ncbi:nucleotidyltransferase domain-containing protein [Paenibacillus xerothermodurans]|uniref:Amino acid transporter n=1 Tax=Paenibacillus xerothermodurans TaxID=1977292 RepID=A0A2W1N588_PAEXE|nr:hypothetical protein [Paenibacillus xerothermodurans]PZE19869.1 hypothetical protein CBW46_016215 [Paenibacillus xerothermodurans]
MEPCDFIHFIMKDFKRPWGIAGGWSTDLFLGAKTRDHADIEIIIFRNDQLAMQEHLLGWSFKQVRNGLVAAWAPGETLDPPIHETYADKANEKIEILLNECDFHHWIYRRDNRIRRDLNKTILVTPNGIPFLSPEITLLYKSKNARAKDETDFSNTCEHMNLEQKHWLRAALQLTYIEHPWIRLLK